MKREEQTWEALLAPHVPAEPFAGPLVIRVRMIYPHLRAVRARDRNRLLPKITRPDASNIAKQLEDVLKRMRFFYDDAQVASLTVEKVHGPELLVGIMINIRPWGGSDADIVG